MEDQDQELVALIDNELDKDRKSRLLVRLEEDAVLRARYEALREALVRTGLTQHNLPADCSNDRADECSTWTNSSKAAISIAK